MRASLSTEKAAWLRRAGLFAAVVLWFVPSIYCVKVERQIRSKQKDLRRIENQLSRKTSEHDAVLRKERELADEVARTTSELTSSRRALKDVQERVRETEQRRKSAEERLWASRLEIGQWDDLLDRELRIFYQREIAMRSAAQVELAYRRAALRDKVQGLKFAREHHAQVQTLRDQLLDLEVELQKLRLNREHEERRVQSARRQMRSLYKTAQGRRAILEREIDDLQVSARELTKFLDDLIRQQVAEQARAAAAAAAAGKKQQVRRPAFANVNRQRGRLPWPVDGKVVERYGRSHHPELDTYVFSNGIKLQTPPAAPVRSVEKGEVLYAGEFMSYGLMALVQHADNLHGVYAHLGSLNVSRGQKVSVGEQIGTAGPDDEGHPQVYFELRVGGVAVDPLVWLK